jgi:hypothetical protein
MGNRISEKRKKELYIIYLYKLPYTIEPVKDLSVNHIRPSPRFPTSQKKRSFEHRPDSLFHFQIITHTHTHGQLDTSFFSAGSRLNSRFLIWWKEEAQRPTDRWASYFLTREDFQQFDSHFQLNRLCSDFPSFLKKFWMERERDPCIIIYDGGKNKRDTRDKYKLRYNMSNENIFPFRETLGLVEFWPLTFLNLFRNVFHPLLPAPDTMSSLVEWKREQPAAPDRTECCLTLCSCACLTSSSLPTCTQHTRFFSFFLVIVYTTTGSSSRQCVYTRHATIFKRSIIRLHSFKLL